MPTGIPALNERPYSPSTSVYLQPGRPGDRLASTHDNPMILVEVPANGAFAKRFRPSPIRRAGSFLGNSYRFRSVVAKAFGSYELHFSKIGYNWLIFCVDKPPVTGRNGQPLDQTQYGTMRFTDRERRVAAMVSPTPRLSVRPSR